MSRGNTQGNPASSIRGTPAAKAPSTNPFHEIRKRELKRERRCLDGQPTEAEPSYFIPTLKEICAQVIASTFDHQKDIDTLREVDPNLYMLIMDQLRTDLPLSVSVPRVREADYWRSCAEARWTAGQLHDMIAREGGMEKLNGQWKRLFLEHHVAEFMMSELKELNGPSESEDAELHSLCTLCASEIQKLYLPKLRCHVNFAELFTRLPQLKSLYCSFGVLNAGVTYAPEMSGMREEDANRLQLVMKSTNVGLTSLSLPENAIGGDLCRALVAGLVRNKALKYMDLSHNVIDDAGANALGIVLLQPEIGLETLLLHDNNIGDNGAVMLGQAFSVNKSLKTVTLALNRVHDHGSVALFSGLSSNKSITNFDLSSNAIGLEGIAACCTMMAHNTTLLHLHLFGNAGIGIEGGAMLAEALDNQPLRSLLELDVRHSSLSVEDEQRISLVTHKRMSLDQMQAVDAEAAARKKLMDAKVKDKIRKSYGPEAAKA